jgi:predicted MFS family arabinose efflux permease
MATKTAAIPGTTSAAPKPLAVARLLAVGSGISVFTIYLSQPLLNLLATVFHSSVREMGLVTTTTQVGFAAGLVFLVPLGDVISKKKLILAKLVLASAALAATGSASSAGQLIAGSLAIGLFGSAAQDCLPLAAELSPPEIRGRSIGTVMAGLLFGILSSRVVSGILADAAGWRAPFHVSAGLVLVVAFLVWRRVPSVDQAHESTYPALLRSTATLAVTEPLLILSTLGHGFVGFTFSAFWTTLSFHLGQPRFHLGPSQIGAFALAGIAGAAMAPVTGRLSDRHGPLFTIRVSLALVGLSFASMLVLPGSLVALALATIGFDLGAQVSMVSHQTIIYSLKPSARSRINSVYVGGLFGFFALGSFAATWVFSRFDWAGVVLLCLASCATSALVHAVLTRRWKGRSAGGNPA